MAAAALWYGAPTVEMLGSASYVSRLAVAVLAAIPLGWFLGAMFVWPIFSRIGAKVNGAPYRQGDRVCILVGRYRGRSAQVYEVWSERREVLVRFDIQGKAEATREGFHFTEVCRERTSDK